MHTSPRTPPDDDAPHRQLRWLYASEIITGLGDGVFWVALVSVLSGEERFGVLVSLAVVARLGPRAALSLPAGSLVDRSPLRRLLLGCDLVRAGLMVGLGIAVEAGLTALGVLAVMLLAYVAGVPSRPALAAAVPHVAGESHLAHANAAISAIRQVMTFVGPMIGVALVTVSAPMAIVVNGATFALSAACIAAMRGVPWPDRVNEPLRQPERARRTHSDTGGLGVVRAVDGLPALVGLIGAMYFVRGAELVLHVLVVRDLLDAEPSTIGYLSGAVGIGAILTTPLARRAASGSTRIRSAVVTSVALTAVPTAALAAANELTVAAMLIVPVGAGMVLFEVMSVITVQRTISPEAFGRAFGAVNAASNIGKLAGAVVMPLLAGVFGVEWALVGLSAALAAVTLVTLAPLRSLGAVADDERRRIAPIVHTLAGLEIFAGTPPTALERLAETVSEEVLVAGSEIITEGDHPDDLFVARAGEFAVTVGGTEVSRLGADDWFGEIGLVEGVPRTATVTAITAATVWRIDGDVFLATLASAGEAPEALLAGIADRLAATRSHR